MSHMTAVFQSWSQQRWPAAPGGIAAEIRIFDFGAGVFSDLPEEVCQPSLEAHGSPIHTP